MEAHIRPQPEDYKVRHFMHVIRLQLILDASRTNYEKALAFHSERRAEEIRIMESQLDGTLEKRQRTRIILAQEAILREEINYCREKLQEIEGIMKQE